MMRGFFAASSSAGRKACSASRPSSRSTSALFSNVAKLGFMGTAWMSSTPVAMLRTSSRSPPMCRAMSARSGMVATTLILSAAGPDPGRTTSATTSAVQSKCFIMHSSSILEAVDVAAEDHRPLQEELVDTIVGLLEPRVLQAEALELGCPERQVGRVGVGRADDVVHVLRELEQEARVVTARETRLEIAVESVRITALEQERRRRGDGRVGDGGRREGRLEHAVQPEGGCRGLRGEPADRPVLLVVERFGAPHEAAIARLAERGVAIREVDARQVALRTVVELHFGGVGPARPEVQVVRVRQAEEGRGPAEIRELGEVARHGVVDARVLRPHLVVRAG